MAERFGVDVRVWAGMTSYERMQARKEWMKQRAARALARKKAQQVSDRRKRYRQKYKEAIGAKKKELVETPEPKTLTRGQYISELEERKTETGRTAEEYEKMKFASKQQYLVDGMPMHGFIAQAAVRQKATELRDVEQIYERGIQEAKVWHPKTKITKTETGYQARFPYAGAQKYRKYKKELKEKGLLGEITLAFTPENPLGIAAGVESLLGHKQKAIDIKIQAIHRVKQVKDPLSFIHFWFESPQTQVVLGVAGGYGVSKAVPYVAGRAASKFGLTAGRIVTGTAVTTGVSLAGLQTYNIARLYQKGEVGRATAHGVVFGLQFAGAYAGYRLAGGRAGWEKSFKKGFIRQQKAQPHEIEMMLARQAEKVDVKTQVEFYQMKGTPTEKSLLRVSQLTKYKPSKEVVMMSRSAYEKYSRPGITDVEYVGGTRIRGAVVTETGSKPLLEGFGMGRMGFRLFKGKYGYSLRSVTRMTYRQPTIKEVVGFGGFTKQIHKTIPVSVGGEIPMSFAYRPTAFTIPTITPLSYRPSVQMRFTSLIKTIKPSYMVFPLQQPRVKPVFQTSLISPTIALRQPIAKVFSMQQPTSISVLEFQQFPISIKEPVVDIAEMPAQKSRVVSQLVAQQQVTPHHFVSFETGLPYMPKPRLHGFGAGSYLGPGGDLGYRFREFKIPSLEKIVKKVGL